MLSKQFLMLCNRIFISGVTMLPLREKPWHINVLPLISQSKTSVNLQKLQADVGAQRNPNTVINQSEKRATNVQVHPRIKINGFDTNARIFLMCLSFLQSLLRATRSV